MPAADDARLPSIDPAQVHLVAQVVEADAHDLHCRYLSRRPRVLTAAAAADRAVTRAQMSLRPAAAGVLAASSTLLFVRRRIA